LKALKYLLSLLAVLILLYFAGPKPPTPVLDKQLPVVEGSVEDFVTSNEIKAGFPIRPGCEAKILWANDSTKQITEYVLLYLHGFSATRREGYPVNEEFAAHFGCNAYLARLASHGLVTEDPLIDMTPDRLYNSAKEALSIACQLGKKVVVMGCSTGCTLALKLASDFPDLISGLILYSPNVQIKQKSAALVSGHWGLQIARLNLGSNYRVVGQDKGIDYCKFWYCRYRAEGIVYLQQLLDATMRKELFEKVKCPVFMGYYYRDEQHQDQVVEVKASMRMFGQLGTADINKRSIAFANAGDHVIASDLISHSVPEVRTATFAFAREILKMSPVR
jgi:esterase/lipase